MNLKSPSGCNVTMKATRLGHTLIFYFILILKKHVENQCYVPGRPFSFVGIYRLDCISYVI
jgi:hypothetical protein